MYLLSTKYTADYMFLICSVLSYFYFTSFAETG